MPPRRSALFPTWTRSDEKPVFFPKPSFQAQPPITPIEPVTVNGVVVIVSASMLIQ